MVKKVKNEHKIHLVKTIMPSVDSYLNDIKEIETNYRFTNNGFYVQKFEEELKKYLETDREVIVTSSGTTALQLAIKSLDLKKVLVPSFTFVATINALELCNVEYDYVDIDVETWCIDVNEVIAKLSSGNYDAILPVNVFGNLCNIDALEVIANKYNVKLLFDSAGCMGGEYKGKKVGNFGDIEIFSLHATKSLPVGEGGFLSVKSKEVADKIRLIKNFGLDSNNEAVVKGLNGKMPEILACIGIKGLENLDNYVLNRKKYVEYYKNNLNLKFQKFVGDPTLQILGVLIDDKKEFIDYMVSHNIEIREYFMPVHLQKAYKRDIYLKNTEDIYKKIINIPLHSEMSLEMITFVCDKINEWLMKNPMAKNY